MSQSTAVAIVATFTCEPIVEVIDLWARELGLDLRVLVGPYHQVHQELLDPAGLIGRNAKGLNVVLARLEDWSRGEAPIGSGVRDFVRALQAAAARTSAPFLVCFCPASGGADSSEDERAAQAEIAGAAEVVTSAELLDLYPVADFCDPHSDRLGHLPYTPALFAALGTLVARRLYALMSPPCKVVIADCDNTLWAGVAGEDGPRGVVLDPPRRALQELLVAQHDAGALIGLCSKNDEADVEAVWQAHPEMPLQPAHVIARRVSWRPKSESLRSLAAELGVSLDSFVFLDDDPLERAEVRAGCPEVITAELPRDPAAVPGFLRHFWALDRARSTGEDQRRTALYQTEQRREEARRSAGDLEAFLDGLGLVVTMTPLSLAELPRAAQLTQRTNQLNVTTRRRTEAELRALWEQGALEALVVDVRDRFGAYGISGLVLFACRGGALAVDTLLVSCRALGRGVEERILAHLGRLSLDRGLARVEVPFVATSKNGPAQRLLDAIGGATAEPEGAGVVYRFPAAHLARLRRLPRREAPVAEERVEPSPSAAPIETEHAGRSELLNRIAAELSDPRRVAELVAQSKRRSRGAAAFTAGSVEEKLAAIWAEVLHIEGIGAGDNFFEIGGQSIAMVRVISRVREAFGVDVSPQVFFAAPTIGGLSRAIAELTASAAAPDEIAALLDLVERMPAEEVAARMAGSPARPAMASARGLIRTLAIVTCDRPAALSRSLESYLDNCARHGRSVDVVILDDSRSAANRAASREVAAALCRARGVSGWYAGPAEKAAFAEALIARGLPPHVVRFALAPERSSTAGANRNALLLHAVGEALFTADDDTIGRCALPPGRDEGAEDALLITSGQDPAEHWFFPDREAAMGAVSFVDRDILGGHEALLGRDARAVLGESARGGRVLATFNGLLGDSGWGAPFGAWLAPMGYLAMRGLSRGRLCASEPSYRAAIESREIVRAVRRLTIADPAFSMMGFAGLDNRELLPPFCPIGRGEDNVFGAALAASLPDAYVGHLPWTLVHAPAEPRRFWAGEMARTAGSVDLGRIVIALVRAFAIGPEATDKETRLRAIGEHLVDLAVRPRELDAIIHDRIARADAALAAFLEAELDAAGGAPVWWAADVRRYLAGLAGAADRAVALDLADGGDLETARARTWEAVAQFGELLACWPDLVGEARSLRAREIRPAVRIEGPRS